ncbi:MAG: hypothetical protein Q7R81_00135 [Candidatus Peregrinibacteria bacterium]|nr:hypothetical protein [Candidatus Peregrinibacteria bacterium]
MSAKLHHLVVYVPLADADRVREALAKAGAGAIGAYDSCSFSMRGTGRFRPLQGATPAIGEVGSLEAVEEERIEVVVTEEQLRGVLRAVKEVHSYEEPAIHVLPMEDYRRFL